MTICWRCAPVSRASKDEPERVSSAIMPHAPDLLNDRLGRPLGSLRISVTDRCNIRCQYCMPEDEYVWLPRASILTFEEIGRLARVFADLGAGKIRLTGGEPLLRQDLPQLVRRLANTKSGTHLAPTTNGLT